MTRKPRLASETLALQSLSPLSGSGNLEQLFFQVIYKPGDIFQLNKFLKSVHSRDLAALHQHFIRGANCGNRGRYVGYRNLAKLGQVFNVERKMQTLENSGQARLLR